MYYTRTGIKFRERNYLPGAIHDGIGIMGDRRLVSRTLIIMLEGSTMTIAVETFDSIHAAYLAARARAADDTLTEEQNLEASREDDRLLWRLIRTPAPCKARVEIKVALVAEMIEIGQWADDRELFMLASIRADLARLS